MGKKRNFVALRLNEDKDKDIIDDLARFSVLTDRVKEAYRMAMKVERGELALSKPSQPQPEPSPPKTYIQSPPYQPKEEKPNNPSKPLVDDKAKVKSNIIQSF